MDRDVETLEQLCEALGVQLEFNRDRVAFENETVRALTMLTALVQGMRAEAKSSSPGPYQLMAACIVAAGDVMRGNAADVDEFARALYRLVTYTPFEHG